MVSIVCVVVHPSPIAREGLKAILADSPFSPVSTASSTDEVPSTIASAGEHLLILMGVREAAHLAQAMSAAKASFPDALVVVIGDSGRLDLVMTALALGAATFIDENVATSALIAELELVAQGQPVISVVLAKRLLGPGRALNGEQSVAPLTPDQRQLREPEDENEDENEAGPHRQLSGREAAILNALVQGKSNKVIAYQLCIAEATVKVHVKAILRKIRVQNRTQAAIWALHHQSLPRAKANYRTVRRTSEVAVGDPPEARHRTSTVASARLQSAAPQRS